MVRSQKDPISIVTLPVVHQSMQTGWGMGPAQPPPTGLASTGWPGSSFLMPQPGVVQGEAPTGPVADAWYGAITPNGVGPPALHSPQGAGPPYPQAFGPRRSVRGGGP